MTVSIPRHLHVRVTQTAGDFLNVYPLVHEQGNENIADLLEQLNDLINKRAVILRQLSDADTKIKQKREAMLAIERENCMTVSAALRTIPKDVCKDDKDDELLRALRGE